VPFPFAAILSDLDGVLVDSADAVDRAWRRWAGRHAIDPRRLEGLTHGVPSLEVIRQVAPELDAAAESAWVEQAQVDDVGGVRALPGAPELLGPEPPAPVAVVTSCTDALAAARLRAAGLRAPAVLVTAGRVRAGKPDPEGYEAAAAALGADPAACLVVEDAPAGVAAGRAAGAVVVGVTTTYDAAELSGADAIAPTLAAALARFA